jgi:hydroxyacylglutathione hydrolase
MRITNHLALVASSQFGISCPWDCHIYALRAPHGIILIDAGSGYSADKILDSLQEYWPNEKLVAIVLTHAHPDHACGAAILQQKTNCDVYAPATAIHWIHTGDEHATGLAEARAQGAYPADLKLLPCPAAIPYCEDEPLIIAGQAFTPLQTRGHSADSHCLLTTHHNQRLLFSGDTLFYGPVFGVINREDSGMNGYRQDLHKLESLNVDALLPGHGLFTLTGGQRHVDKALEIVHKGFLPRQIGQFDLLF